MRSTNQYFELFKARLKKLVKPLNRIYNKNSEELLELPGHSIACTIKKALEDFEAEIDNIAQIMNESYKKALFNIGVSESKDKYSENRKKLLCDSWPIPISTSGSLSLHILLSNCEENIDPGYIPRGQWPRNVTQPEFASWFRKQRFSWLTKRPRCDTWYIKIKEQFIPVDYVVLYAIEKAKLYTAPNPKPPRDFAIDARSIVVRVCNIIGGADIRRVNQNVTVQRNEELSLEFRWTGPHDNEEVCFVPYTKSDDSNFKNVNSVFSLIAQSYGRATVRDFALLYAFAWFAGGTGEHFWWWADEHLKFSGIKPTSKNKKALIKRLKQLEKAILTVRYQHGPPIRGPLITLGRYETVDKENAMTIDFHKGLYRGINNTEDRYYYYWTVPLTVFKVDPKRKKSTVPLAVPVLAQIFRANLKSGQTVKARIKVKTLADQINARGYQVNSRDKRLRSQFKSDFEFMKKADYISSYSCSDFGNLNETITVEPGKQSLSLIERKKAPDFPVPIPSTGLELRKWLEFANMTAREAGQHLNISSRSMYRGLKRGDSPLPLCVRSAFSKHFWQL